MLPLPPQQNVACCVVRLSSLHLPGTAVFTIHQSARDVNPESDSYTTNRIAPPGELRPKLLICQGINESDRIAAMVKGLSDNGNIPVLLHEFHGVNLAGRVRRYVLGQAEQLRRPFHIFPHRLPGSVLSPVRRGFKGPPPCFCLLNPYGIQ